MPLVQNQSESPSVHLPYIHLGQGHTNPASVPPPRDRKTLVLLSEADDLTLALVELPFPLVNYNQQYSTN